jgi:hypothetical protein
MTMTESTLRPSVSGSLGPAEVLEPDTTGEFVRVRRQGSWELADGWARIAVANCPALSAGDRVLVAGEQADELYVIGVLSCVRPPRLEISGGVYAERGSNLQGGDTLRVLSARHELLFEIDPAAGATRLAIPSGSLELLASQGDLILRAGGTVRVEGHSVELHAQHRLTLTVGRGLAAAGTWLRLLPQTLQVGSQRVELSARHGDVKVSSAAVSGEQISVEAEQYQLKAVRVETMAETIIERSGSVYRTVRDLLQLQTGRLRTYVAGLSHFRSKRAWFSAEETMHIDGEKVQLG